jgi:threonine aldolase
LAQGLHGLTGLTVRSAHTNIVFVDVSEDRGPALLAHLRQDGVLATGLIGLRFVTHLDIDADDIDHTLESVRRFFHTSPAQTGSSLAEYSKGPY